MNSDDEVQVAVRTAEAELSKERDEISARADQLLQADVLHAALQNTESNRERASAQVEETLRGYDANTFLRVEVLAAGLGIALMLIGLTLLLSPLIGGLGWFR
ncbi:MAG: hypothetical protein QM817_34845 [Archangium sp.]